MSISDLRIKHDFLSSLGSYTLTYAYEGDYVKLGSDCGEIEISKIKYRIYDGFDFKDGSDYFSQNLGLWEHKVFEQPVYPKFIPLSGASSDEYLVENKDFTKLYNKITDKTYSKTNENDWDFNVITKYIDVNPKIDSIKICYDIFGSRTVKVTYVK